MVMDEFEQRLEKNKDLIRQIWESGYIAGVEKIASTLRAQNKEISEKIIKSLLAVSGA